MEVRIVWFFFFQAEDGIRDVAVTGVQTCALPISIPGVRGNGASISSRTRSSPLSKGWARSEEHTSELQSRLHLVCRLLLEKKKNKTRRAATHWPSRSRAG